MASCFASDEFIRHVDFRPMAVQLARGIYHAIQRKNNRGVHVLALSDLLGDSLGHQGVAFHCNLFTSHPKTSKVDAGLPAVLQFRRDKAAAAAGAGSRDVTMHVQQAPLRKWFRRAVRVAIKSAAARSTT